MCSPCRSAATLHVIQISLKNLSNGQGFQVNSLIWSCICSSLPCSAPPLFAWAGSQTLNSPVLCCPNQACLLKRGFGWLLCKHKSPREIWFLWRVAPERITGRRINIVPALKTPLHRSLAGAGAWFFLSGLYNTYIDACLSPVSAVSRLGSFLPQRLGGGAAVRLYDPPNHPMCWRSGQGRAAVRNVTARSSTFLHSA